MSLSVVQRRPRGRTGPEAAPENISRFHADLARQILGLARERKLGAGHQLKEQWLAEELGVSRSPVRAALRLLAARGMVRSVPNQGCFLTDAADGRDPEDWDIPPTGEERLHLAIIRDRFARRLDQRINVTELVRRYGVTRSMVGRVLSRLADEGLVEREPGRPWSFVPSLDEPAIYEDSYRFRILVEPEAILGPGFRPDPVQIERLRRVHVDLLDGPVHTAPFQRLVDADADFHQTIAGFSGNRFIIQAIQQQTRLRRFVEYQFGADRDRMAESCREHMAILDALGAGDLRAAAELMREHIAVSRDLRPSFRQPGRQTRASKRT